jgi:hypothetical protein
MKYHWRLILIILAGILSIECTFEENKHTFVPLEQVQNIYSQIELPSDFQEIDSNSSARRQSSLTSHFYKSSLPYLAAKNFFNSSLTRNNWVYDKEEIFESISADEYRRRFGYKKEGCELWVEYGGLSPNNRWNYGISLVC